MEGRIIRNFKQPSESEGVLPVNQEYPLSPDEKKELWRKFTLWYNEERVKEYGDAGGVVFCTGEVVSRLPSGGLESVSISWESADSAAITADFERYSVPPGMIVQNETRPHNVYAPSPTTTPSYQAKIVCVPQSELAALIREKILEQREQRESSGRQG